MARRNYSRWKRNVDRLYAALTPAQWPARLAWRLHPWGVVAEEHTIHVDAAAMHGRELRIAFASDFHAGAATPWPLLEACVHRLNRLRPDLLLLGGDFVSIDPGGIDRLAPLLGTVHAPLGRFAVLGNHDHQAGAPAIVDALTRAGIEMLTNRAIMLPEPFGHIGLCGLDDYTCGAPDAERAFAGTRAARVVLMHAPSNLLDIGDRRFDVALCGHTHGGQIALPGGHPIFAGSGPLSRRYNAGRYDLNPHGTLLVSRGVGCGTLPIRWNSPSSVFLCRLVNSRFAPSPSTLGR